MRTRKQTKTAARTSSRISKRRCRPPGAVARLPHTGVDVQMTVGECALSSTTFPTFARSILSQLVQFRDSILGNTHHLTVPVGDTGRASKKKKQQQHYMYEVGRLLGLFPAYMKNPLRVSYEHYASVQDRELLVQLVHTPKCGGRFLKAHLRRLQLPLPKKYNIFPKSIRVFSPKYNCTLVFINGHLPARNFTQEALVIGMLREPYARMASAYSYLRDGAHSWNDWDTVTRDKLKRFTSISIFLKDASIRKKFLSLTRGKKHFFPQTHWLCDDQQNGLIDLPLFQEDLNGDINRLCALLGIPLVKDTDERINETLNRVELDDAAKKLVDTHWWPGESKVYHQMLSDKEQMFKRFETKLNAYAARIGAVSPPVAD